MKFFTDGVNVFAYEADGSQDAYIKPTLKQITEQEADTLRAKNAAALFDTLSIAEKRAGAYPPIGDQLDALFHAGVFPSDMAAKIQAVKDRYPK